MSVHSRTSIVRKSQICTFLLIFSDTRQCTLQCLSLFNNKKQFAKALNELSESKIKLADFILDYMHPGL